MFKLIVVLLSLSFICQGYQGLNDEIKDCDKLGILFYEDIGCKPVKVEGKACPVQFKCDDDFTIKTDTCLFKSKVLKVGEAVDDALTEFSCKVKCTCNAADKRQRGLFTCLIPVCPKHSDEAGCYFVTNDFNECCSNKKICHNDPDTVRCQWLDGYQHTEGATMDSNHCDKSSGCSKCVCKKGFEGKLVEPFCKRRDCLVQLKFSDKLAQNCAPVYFGKERCHLCCPDTFICPTDTDVVKQVDWYNESEDNSGLQCKFGNRTLKLGEGVERTVDYHHSSEGKKVTCKCVMPPFLTCQENRYD